MTPTPTPTGETLGAVVLLDDVTDLANLERARDEFFSIASHELRTPLTAIRGNTTMIQEYYGQKIKDKDVTSMLSDIHDSSVRLIAIVNDFLDMSRLEQGRIRFKFEKINAVDICRKAASEIQSTPAIPVVPIKISQPKPALPLVMADPDRLLQVVTNLIGNSLKFTERGSITIRFSQTDQNVIITVTDTGRGIAPEAKHLLFRKFQQASDDILTRDSTRSTGLGLYISRNLMRSMSGDLELVDSKLDEGSTFAVTVPIAKK
jgi:signal transduction histidine kinase